MTNPVSGAPGQPDDATKAELERSKMRYEADLKREQADRDAAHELLASQRNAKYELERAKWTAEYEQANAYHKAIIDHSTKSIDRARSGAEFVEKAAAAIGGIYAGLLGLVFVADSNPLPARGAIAALFLGLAIALAAAYLAFLNKATKVPGRIPASSLRETQEERTFFYERWVRAGVMSRRYAARAAVIALAVGVMFLPAAFIGSSAAEPLLAVPSSAPEPNNDISDPTQREQAFRQELETYRNQSDAAISLALTGGQADEADPVSGAAWVLLTVWGLLAVFGLPAAYEQIEQKREQGALLRSWVLPALVISVALVIATLVVALSTT